MTQNFDEVIEKYRQRLNNDERIDDVVDNLHTDGLTITETMKALRLLYGIGLGEAKKIVTTHPAWALVVRANEPFHEELEKFAEAWSSNRLQDFNTIHSEDIGDDNGKDS